MCSTINRLAKIQTVCIWVNHELASRVLQPIDRNVSLFIRHHEGDFWSPNCNQIYYTYVYLHIFNVIGSKASSELIYYFKQQSDKSPNSKISMICNSKKQTNRVGRPIDFISKKIGFWKTCLNRAVSNTFRRTRNLDI